MPALRNYKREYAVVDTSKSFRFYLTASNIVGSIATETVSFVLAAVPDKPSSKPNLNLQYTTASAIHVDYASLS